MGQPYENDSNASCTPGEPTQPSAAGQSNQTGEIGQPKRYYPSRRSEKLAQRQVQTPVVSEDTGSSIPLAQQARVQDRTEINFSGFTKWKPTAHSADETDTSASSAAVHGTDSHQTSALNIGSMQEGTIVADGSAKELSQTHPSVTSSGSQESRLSRKTRRSRKTSGSHAQAQAFTESGSDSLSRTSVLERLETMTGSIPQITEESDLQIQPQSTAAMERVHSVKESMETEMKKNKKRARIAVLVTLLLVLALAGGGVTVGIMHYGSWQNLKERVFGSEDYEGNGTGKVEVEIPKGATGAKIGQILQDDGVIKSANLFTDLFAKNESARNIQAGKYELHEKMSARAALAILLDPKSKRTNYLSIPPGFTVKQLKERLVKSYNFPQSTVDAALDDPSLYGVNAPSLEGWLAPYSYEIENFPNLNDLVKQMVDITRKNLKDLNIPEAKWYDTLKIGSIIEREVNKPEYYGKVARVVENRIQPNSPTHGLIQMDSTVLYGLGLSGGVPTKAQLKVDTPYNSYLHPGLPPTPIGAVGTEALKAASNPADGDWLYFVTINLQSGETVFSSTYEQHEANVQLLQKWCESNPGKCR